MSDKTWYYAKDDQQLGPVTALELKRMALAGELTVDDLVWRPGFDEWSPVGSVKGLLAESVPQRRADPPTPPQHNGPTPVARRPVVTASATPAIEAAPSGPVKLPVSPPTPRPATIEAPPVAVDQTPIDDSNILEAALHPAPAAAATVRVSESRSISAGAPLRLVVWLSVAMVVLFGKGYLAIQWFSGEAATFAPVAWFIMTVDLGAFLFAFAVEKAVEAWNASSRE